MNFLRNPEVKKTIYLFVIFTVVFVGVGLAISVTSGIVISFACIVFSMSHFVISKKRYDKIANLSLEIDQILHGSDTINLNHYCEGEVAILQNSLNKMIVRLREQAHNLQKDKVYLADFLADISHQLRTPLTSINLIVSLLEKPDVSNERKSELRKELMLHLSRTDWLVNTLLKMSKIDAGMATFQKNHINIKELIKKAIEPLAIPMELREQQLKIDMEGEVAYIGDLSWSVEAVTNIIKNCMEHTPVGGEITVTTRGNELFAEIIISDNGHGIDKDDLPYLFDRFYKGKNSSDQSIGIGLALARMIVQKQNGVIKAENNKNGGAKFTIKLYKRAV